MFYDLRYNEGMSFEYPLKNRAAWEDKLCAIDERNDTGRHSKAREREVRFAEEHESSTNAARAALSIPHVSPRTTLAQAFRWNVPGIASLLPFVPTVKTLPSVPLRCVRVVRTNSGFRARPKHFS